MEENGQKYKTEEGSKITFDLAIATGWKVAEGESENFKVFLSSDDKISSDDTEIRMVEPATIESGKHYSEFVNVFKRMDPVELPDGIVAVADENDVMYFTTSNSYITNEEYNGLDENVKNNCTKFYRRTLEETLESDYDIERVITYEFDGPTKGTYYILIQSDSSKSQNLQTEMRTIEITIPSASEDTNYYSFAYYDKFNNTVGETFTADAGKSSKSITLPYGSTRSICVQYNTKDADAKYYNLIGVESPGWSCFYGSDEMERVSTDGKQIYAISDLVFRQADRSVPRELIFNDPFIKSRTFTTEMLDTDDSIFQIIDNNYAVNGFELQYSTGDDWIDMEINIYGDNSHYECSMNIRETYSLRLRINDSLNKLASAQYKICYEEMGISMPTWTESDITGITEGEYIVFNDIVAGQNGSLNELITLGVKLKISEIDNTVIE